MNLYRFLTVLLVLALLLAVVACNANTQKEPEDIEHTEKSVDSVQSGQPEQTGQPEQSEKPEQTGQPEQKEEMTYEKYITLSGEEQYAYAMTFPSMTEFFIWYNEVKSAYDAEHSNPEIGGDGDINIGDYIG